MSIQPFAIPFSADKVADLRERLRRTRWPDEVANSVWEYGISLQFLQEVCRYWRNGFDWQFQVKKMSEYHHFRWVSGGFGIHFLHVRGKGPFPVPLILTHGWPGSFVEMLRIIPLLADPSAHGGSADDAFDVVVPSLPGFGFSDRPTEKGMTMFRVAELWTALMGDLGYTRFVAQGGDIGAGVSTALGLRHAENLIGIHLNYIPGSYRPYLPEGVEPQAAEKEFLDRTSRWQEESGAYAHVHRTRPQTAAYGLNDSPAGLAAWILEKFREWSDCDGNLDRRFDRDELLRNVTLYWMTETIGSSMRIYLEDGRAPLHFGPGDFVRVPCALACFPKEIITPPSSVGRARLQRSAVG
jgi:pimeloyl-ACP methyl ester carboxylesterase